MNSLSIKIPVPTQTNIPLKPKDLIDEEVYHPDDVNTMTKFHTLKEMLDAVVKDGKHFSTHQSYIYSI